MSEQDEPEPREWILDGGRSDQDGPIHVAIGFQPASYFVTVREFHDLPVDYEECSIAVPVDEFLRIADEIRGAWERAKAERHREIAAATEPPGRLH